MVAQNHTPARERLNRLAWLLDSSIRLPVLGFRIGIDGLIGLIPGIGDVAGGVLSSYILVQAARLGVPKLTLLRMVFNIVIDTLVGMVPLFGDLFDFAWKANNRNVRLLNAYLDNPRKTTATSGLIVTGVVVGVIGLLIGLLLLGAMVLRWFWQLITG